MPLTGGATDKIGNRYEAYWTIDRMLEVIKEKAESIRLEPPGSDGDGIEFFITKNNEKDYYQVKRQRASGQWTIKNLNVILKNFKVKLRDDRVKCNFVSTISATELMELANRARDAFSYEHFKHNFLTSKILKNQFKKNM